MKALRSVVFANGEVGPLTTAGAFNYEVEKAENDQYENMVTTVKCRGKVTSETAWELREAVKSLLALGGRIIINLSDVNYLDSSGLGALVGLKLSAMKQGYCILEFANVTVPNENAVWPRTTHFPPANVPTVTDICCDPRASRREPTHVSVTLESDLKNW